MRKYIIQILCVLSLVACDKHDPILPGTRTAIFDTTQINVKNQDIVDLPESVIVVDNTNCKYTQDSSNVIWNGEKKIFSGFATPNAVASQQTPVCSGKYLYAGLTTGELVKINPDTRQIVWIADIYRASNLTGGATMVDIIAPIIPYKNSVFAGSLGDAFCKINATNGEKQWCINISVSVPFIITEKYAFVLDTNKKLYAIATKNGDVLWQSAVAKTSIPTYENGIISVGKQQINAQNGKIIK